MCSVSKGGGYELLDRWLVIGLENRVLDAVSAEVGTPGYSHSCRSGRFQGNPQMKSP